MAASTTTSATTSAAPAPALSRTDSTAAREPERQLSDGDGRQPSDGDGGGRQQSDRNGRQLSDGDVAPASEAQLIELGTAFRRVFRGLSRLRGRDTHLGGAELSHAQFELLIELYERGPLPAGELALAAQLTPATVTQMLEHLAEQGHVERVRSEVDRRVVVSELTPSGRRKIAAKRRAWQQRWASALAGMSADELSAATRVLERLGTLFEDAPGAGSCPDSGEA